VAAEVQLPDRERDDADRWRLGVFFGGTGGNFYALDAATGQKLWGRKIGGALGGGVITYTAGGAQKVAVATGLANIYWPTDVATGKIVVLGLGPCLPGPPSLLGTKNQLTKFGSGGPLT
jgi:hypothetical protein